MYENMNGNAPAAFQLHSKYPVGLKWEIGYQVG
jgi:hypothetical protein